MRGGGSRASALGRALALGAMHGPAELLPISSSGHVTLVPWLLGWDREDADPDLRKAFEVALHAGTAAGLLVALRGEVSQAAREATGATAILVVASSLPAAVVGLVGERAIEGRLGTPGSVAAGLIAGGSLLALADLRPQQRDRAEARPADALWLGVAQACALFPGVSRNGATLTAARLLRFRRADAEQLSRHVALPVIAGASALKCLRLVQRGLPPSSGGPFAVGVAASFASTLASTRLIGAVERDAPLWPFAAYRLALGGTALRRLRSERRAGA